MAKQTKTDMRSLVLQVDSEHYSKREPSYEFDSRKFTKPQKTNIRRSNEGS